jgi:hypothetical protein
MGLGGRPPTNHFIAPATLIGSTKWIRYTWVDAHLVWSNGFCWSSPQVKSLRTDAKSVRGGY